MTELNLEGIRWGNDSEQTDSLLKKESKKMLDLSQDERRFESSRCEWQLQKSRVKLLDRFFHKLVWKCFGCPV